MTREDELERRERQKTYFDLVERTLNLAAQSIPAGSTSSYVPYAQYYNGFICYGYRTPKTSPTEWGPNHSGEHPSYGERQVFCGQIPVPPRLRSIAEGRDQ